MEEVLPFDVTIFKFLQPSNYYSGHYPDLQRLRTWKTTCHLLPDRNP